MGGQTALYRGLDPADFAFAGQENQDAAVRVFLYRLAN
jgi:hypothetical protein